MCVCVNFHYVIFVCLSWAPYFGLNKNRPFILFAFIPFAFILFAYVDSQQGPVPKRVPVSETVCGAG